MAKRVFAGVYENMDFPEYTYQEYPKWVNSKRTDADGKSIQLLVHSKSEELKLIDEIVPVEDHDGVLKERDLLARNLELAQKESAGKDAELASLRALLAEKEKPTEKAKPSSGPTLKI